MVEEFTQFLIQELKQEVKAFVKCYTDGDTLVVKFITTGGLTWCFFEDNISVKIVNGLSSSQLAQYIVKTFRKYIFSLYFLNK